MGTKTEHMAEDDPRREELITTAFRDCCTDGQLGEYVGPVLFGVAGDVPAGRYRSHLNERTFRKDVPYPQKHRPSWVMEYSLLVIVDSKNETG